VLPHATQPGRVDRRAGYDGLPFRERRQLLEQVTAYAFDTFGHAVLVNGVDDPQDELRHALGKHIGIKFARALADKSHRHAELAPLGENHLEDRGTNHPHLTDFGDQVLDKINNLGVARLPVLF